MKPWVRLKRLGGRPGARWAHPWERLAFNGQSSSTSLVFVSFIATCLYLRGVMKAAASEGLSGIFRGSVCSLPSAYLCSFQSSVGCAWLCSHCRLPLLMTWGWQSSCPAFALLDALPDVRLSSQPKGQMLQSWQRGGDLSSGLN